MQFNTDGNIALEKSVLNDEASMWNLIQQFETFLNVLLIPYNRSPKKVTYRAQILPTTIYNYKDLAKQYKEHTQLGYSKMLPQVALGQSQSAVLATAYFENEILKLHEIMIPNLMSSTMSSEQILGTKDQANTNKNQNTTGSNNANNASKAKKAPGEEKKVGRAEKPDDQKAEKTIQNKESMN